MNGFKWAKVSLFCVSFLGICTLFYLYSTRHEFVNVSVVKESNRQTEPLKKPDSKQEGAGKWEKPKKDGMMYLAANIALQPKGSKTEEWTSEAMKMMEEELEWRTTAETGNISVYSVTCQKAPGRTKGKVWRPRSPLVIEDTVVRDGDIGKGRTLAMATLPCFLYVNRSAINGARRGVFPRVQLPRGVIFGEYKGEYIATKDDTVMEKSGYAWGIGFTNDGVLYVDAQNEMKSNWLRFVNSARFEEEQNLYPITVESEMYYMVYKDVPADTELLVWYGRNYGSHLGIWYLSNSTGKAGLAAPRSQIVCPLCGGLPTAEELKERILTQPIAEEGQRRSDGIES